MIRVVLPTPLRTLARTGREVQVDVHASPTVEAVLDALEVAYPVLRGTLRDQVSHRRRPFIRFFACQQDLSLLDPMDALLPAAVVAGAEPFMVIGAMAGG
jgi:hypothetical protein